MKDECISYRKAASSRASSRRCRTQSKHLLLHIIKLLDLDRKTKYYDVWAEASKAIERLGQMSKASPSTMKHGAHVHVHSNCTHVVDDEFRPHMAHVCQKVESGWRMRGMHTTDFQLPARVQVQVPLALPVAYALHSTHAIMGPDVNGLVTKAAVDDISDASRLAARNIACSAVRARSSIESPQPSRAPWELAASPQLIIQAAQVATVLRRSDDEMLHKSNGSWELVAPLQLEAPLQLGAQPQPTAQLLPSAGQQLSPQAEQRAQRQLPAHMPSLSGEADMDAVALLFLFRFAEQRTG